MPQNLVLGIILGSASAFFFSSTQVTLSRQLIKLDTRIVNYVSTFIGLLVLFLATGLSLQMGEFLSATPSTWLIYIVVGATQFGFARLLTYVAIKHIGANQATTILPTQVLYSFAFAVMFLGERLLPLTLLGGLLVTAGPLIAEARKGAIIRSGSSKIGLASAALTGLIFGFTPILISVGFSGFPYYLPATTISYAGAVLFNSGLSNPKTVFVKFKGLQRRSIALIIFAGVFTSFAQLTRFAALSFAPIVNVVPFIALYPTFTLILTSAFLRDVEAFGYRTVLSVICATVGAFLVAYSS